MNIIKELDRYGKKLKSGKALQPFEIKEYCFYATMQTLIQLNARTEEQIAETLSVEDMSRTFYMLGKLFFGEKWEAMECVSPEEKEAEDIT